MPTDKIPSLPSRRELLVLSGRALTSSTLLPLCSPAAAQAAGDPQTPLPIPEWVSGVTRIAFLTPGEVGKAAQAGVQVVQTNLIWPYFPLQRDGGGLAPADAHALRELVTNCHRNGMRLVLGLPPFPAVALVKRHPDWRVHPDDTGNILAVEPKENDLGTRFGCNLGPWGDYLIAVCAELVREYRLDGFSFDGNYHPALCYCPACKQGYQEDWRRALPLKVDLDDLAYREYLGWRGERLEAHYRRLQQAIKQANPEAVLMSWSVNGGRYGHFLYSPRAMPTHLNRLFDLPMQEWWLDETNLGGSLAPAFGAAYLRATVSGRSCASEPYLMSRGSPYGTDSFPDHERRTRCLLAVMQGGALAESFGWPGQETGVTEDFREVAKRERWLTHATPLPWAALLVSEQTRQFYAYRDIAERFLPHVLGVFRAATEEHLPLTLLNDWDVTAETLARHAVIVLANAAALSGKQAGAIREYVRGGGGLVATGETSLCDELGRPRRDFALADLFGVSFQGHPPATGPRPALDANFTATLGEDYWRQRTGIATLTWKDHPLLQDARLQALVPHNTVHFHGPLVRVGEPTRSEEVIIRMQPEGQASAPLPALIARQFGKGRVVYGAAALDAALWSYAYPYQRRLLARAMTWAAREPPPFTVTAPMCVQMTPYVQSDKAGRRFVIHLFNGMNTAANHGLPAMEVPLREEIVPIHNIEIRFQRDVPKRFHCEPGNRSVMARRDGKAVVVRLPPLEIHQMLVGEL